MPDASSMDTAHRLIRQSRLLSQAHKDDLCAALMHLTPDEVRTLMDLLQTEPSLISTVLHDAVYTAGVDDDQVRLQHMRDVLRSAERTVRTVTEEVSRQEDVRTLDTLLDVS